MVCPRHIGDCVDAIIINFNDIINGINQVIATVYSTNISDIGCAIYYVQLHKL